MALQRVECTSSNLYVVKSIRTNDLAALRFRRDGESLRHVAARLGCSPWAVRTASEREARRRAQERAT